MAKESEKRRVLFVDVRDQLGGDSVVLLSTLRHLDRAKFEPHVACLRYGRLREALDGIMDLRLFPLDFGTRPKDVPRKGIRGGLHYAGSAMKTFCAILRLASYVRRERIEVIHTSNTLRAAFTSFVVSRLTGRTYIYHAHCGLAESRTQHLFVRSAARVVAVSEFAKQSYLRTGIEEGRVDVCYNGIDAGKLVPSKTAEQMRLELGIKPGKKVIGLVGRLSPLKGHEDLLFAIPKVLAYDENVVFVLVGDDSIFDSNQNYAGHLKNLVARLELQDHVIFTGFRSDTENIYACLDVVVAPSHEEAFGMVVLEGMAMGKPVIASSVGGVPEVLTPDAGILVPPKSPKDLARAIVRVLADPESARLMALQAKQRALSKFTVSNFVAGMEQSLQKAVGMRR